MKEINSFHADCSSERFSVSPTAAEKLLSLDDRVIERVEGRGVSKLERVKPAQEALPERG
ncbi:MAG: hypothetical protein H7A44_08130 [Opitutaceae bacterium]|nr:hypothetical protein [Cephaloticoccus sp.]MCP5530397.1 hypothetical protein [Opitutaceae bacterium]